MKRGLQREQARLLDVHPGLRDVVANDALLGERGAEGRARERTAHHELERALGHADGAHAVMDAPRPEPALGDLEAAALAENHVLLRHADVAEPHLGLTARRAVEAEDAHARAPTSMPGVSRGTRIIECCPCRGAFGSDFPRKMKTSQRGSAAPEMYHFWPLTT